MIKPGSVLYKLLHLRLIDHRPEDKDIEWWARCRLEHICITPYFAYDILRTGIAAIIFLSFMPMIFIAATVLSGLAIAGCQIAIDLRRKTQIHPHTDTLEMVKHVVLLRSLQWGASIALAMYYAPPEMLLHLVPVAVMVMWIEAIALIAVPRSAMINAAINGLAISIPLVLIGSTAAIGAATVAVLSFFALHWLIFHLNYMFATRRLRTRKLTEAKDTIQLLLNQYDQDGSDWLFECTEEGQILRPSARFCAAAGRTAEELEGMPLLDLFYDSPEREELRQMGGQDENFQRLVVPLKVDCEQRWWSISARKVISCNGKRRYWRGFVADVTRAREAEAKINFMAHHDTLTELPNRALFKATAERAFAGRAEGQLIAVLGIDLDHFKQINDTLGHSGGDIALIEAARRIERCVCANSMVARLGGDEFAVLMRHPESREKAIEVAHAIVEAMNEPAVIDGQNAPIGVSVGVAFAPYDGATSSEVIQAADLALFHAKSNGRRVACVFDRGMQEEVQERRQLESDLRDALNNGELELHYQPLVDTQTLETVGYEALLRWNHPTRGAVSPDVFIPIAEETGQIVAIGAWVLREALAEASRWPDHLTVSVNLSPVQTMDRDLFATIVHCLATSGVPAHRLELEITESVLMRECDETIALLHRIRALGVQIALDDFGTGYSSLNYLRAFPFDKIKIDRCFVGDMAERKDSDSIVQAVIALATKLEMRTTAEGIENAGQMDMLRATECTQMQGYLFSKAVPAAQLPHRDADRGSSNARITPLEKKPPAADHDSAAALSRRHAG